LSICRSDELAGRSVAELRARRRQDAGPQQDAGEQLANDSGLSDALHPFTSQSANHDKQQNLSEKYDDPLLAASHLGSQRKQRRVQSGNINRQPFQK
jgi:hypothetical protein